MKTRRLVCDFETTVYEGQDHTEVWAASTVELYTEDVFITQSIGEWFRQLFTYKSNIICWFHNLKFDGSFILDYLINDLKLQQGIIQDETGKITDMDSKKTLDNNCFTYCISDMGMWYSITIKYHSRVIEIRDSLKLMPFTVREIGEAFKTKHQKLDMEYKGYRYAGCEITEKERAYIANDVLVVKEALEIMLDEGHDKLTIGSCCLSEYRGLMADSTYKEWFPDLYEITLDESIYGSPNAGEYIRKSYKGGWCYLAKGKENKKYHNGCTADVNSLYPSMMHSQSGNKYPVGKPHFWTGEMPEMLTHNMQYAYYFIRIKTRFKLKEGMLPTIQLKGNLLYKQTEWLETSDIYNFKTGKYSSKYIDKNGTITDAIPTITLTCVDYELLLEHYDLYDTEILDGCYFWTEIGIFDDYINKYKKIKMESKGAKRTLAKLYLNNLYGKMASNTNSSFKVALPKEDGSIGFITVPQFKKKAGYIAVGSAITSYARRFTITAAQLNYHGVEERGFIYADTDSIHCDLDAEELVGVPIDDTDFCHWKIESKWDEGFYTRQKTYIEHIKTEEGYKYDIKCAGLPDKCKAIFERSMEDKDLTEEEKELYTKDEQEIIENRYTITDFRKGLKIPGKLMPKRIKGGLVLIDTVYEMR